MPVESFFGDASLAFFASTESAKEGTAYSMKPTDGSGDFTFTRGSNLSATYVGKDGYIKKGYENLLYQSNQFDTSPWTDFLINPPTSNQAGYDGSNDAWLISKTDSNGRIQQSVSGSGVNVFSVYAKRADSDYILLQMVGGVNPNARFSLITGENVSTFGSVATFSEPIGNGWFRFTLVGDASLSLVRIYPSEETGNTATSGSIYIQDAMLNQGLVAYPYLETTTAKAINALTDNEPRYDWSSGSAALLLEPGRTNIIEDSEYFADRKYSSTIVTQNYGTSPEGVTNSALLDKNGTPFGRIDYVSSYPSGTYAFSVFVKGINVVKLRFDYSGGLKEGYINCGNGQTTNNSLYPMDSISSVDYGNGWYRFTCTAEIPNGATITFARIYVMDVIGGEGNTNPATAEIYGAQLEEGTYPTSYIPTYGTTEERVADNCYKTNLLSSIGQNEGTLFIEWEQQLSDDIYAMFGLNDGLNNNRIQLVLNHLRNSRIGLVYRVNSISHYSNVNIQSLDVDTTYKAAIVYTQTSIKMYLNGEEIVNEADFNASGGVFNELAFRYNSSDSSFSFTIPVYKSLVFPTALSYDDCISLTTP